MNDDEIRKESGSRIRAARKKIGLSREQVSNLAGWDGVRPTRLSNYENGIRMIGVQEANILGRILNVEPGYLLTTLSERQSELLRSFDGCDDMSKEMIRRITNTPKFSRTSEFKVSLTNKDEDKQQKEG